MGGLILFVVVVLLYFIPAIVGKDKRNAGAILVLNLLLGWTLVGWVVALVWAMTAEEPAPTTATEQPPRYLCPRCKQPVGDAQTRCTSCGVAFSQKKCPDCAELIKADARKCRFCGRKFDAAGE